VDLYRNSVAEVDIPFVNVYKSMTMLTYNPRLPVRAKLSVNVPHVVIGGDFQALTAWDGGNPLSFPVKFEHSRPPDDRKRK